MEVIAVDARKKKKKPFKILCIDGGGIKGLYAATLLSRFEEWNKCLLSDHFDMICGTSTGGIITLGISQRIPMSNICDFYKNYGPEIFNEACRPKLLFGVYRKVRDKIRQTIFRGKFSNKALRRALEAVFQDKTIGDSHNLLCIPSYSYSYAQNRVFKFDHLEGTLNCDNNKSCVDIALATSAAPTYFPLCDIGSEQFIDGGVWANNPTLVGLIEALTYFVGKEKEYNEIQVLSIGCISKLNGNKLNKCRNRPFILWGGDLFDIFNNGQSDFAHYFMSKISEVDKIPITYRRIDSRNVSSEQCEYVELDNASKDALCFFERKGNETANEYKRDNNVQSFFKTKKTYLTHK